MKRINFLTLFFIFFCLLIIIKLFFLQIVWGDKLSLNAENQHFSALDIPAKRGEIHTADNFPLASSQTVYLIYATLPDLKEVPQKIASLLSPLFIAEDSKEVVPPVEIDATDSAKTEEPPKKEDVLKTKTEELVSLFSLPNRIWVPLKHKVSKDLMENIKNLHIEGIGFEEEEKRFYPEASNSAQILGFVGSDPSGRDKGYFGLEGFYNGELRGRAGRLKEEVDALGRPILVGSRVDIPPEDGRNLILNIDRGVQYIVENRLREGVKKYEAKSGSVLVMDPSNGALIASASFPNYDPSIWDKYDRNLYRNPAINDVYEPGSTFKVITAAAAIDSGAIDTKTVCPCSGPRKIGQFEIRTWNNKYFPKSTIADILQHSDNVGSVFVSEKLGQEKFLNYLDNFGFGKETGVDLEGESSGILRDRDNWQPIDLATASFGQGHSVSMLQMVRAVSVIANGGELYQPQVVRKIVGRDRTVEIKPRLLRRVLKKETASTVTELMVNAVENGEARHFVPKGYRIAGKTGTAQMPIEGRYDPNKTVASFIGFAPADNPKFIMLVKLDEPKTSPWGSTTAAPLYFDIAKELFAYWGIAPNR